MYKYFLYLLLLVCFGCTYEPEVIHFGKDPCEHCKMTITDQKFGAEIVTNKGRVYKFDAIECMIAYIKNSNPEILHILAVPLNNPKNLQNKDSLVFVISHKIKSPMGASIAALTNRLAIESLLGKEENVYSWEELYTKIKQ